MAAEALRRIRTLYEIEVELKDLSPEARAVQRQARSEPRLKDFRTWLDDTLLKLPPGSRLAKAIGYALGRWAALRV